ncbi:MAG: Crp/Fnr family transcriptional regulator [Elusimicrobia bacterium]|nr:Crp/Fnr family transcriptional regulator [Elusimicrobiota bacterium]
MTIKSILSRVSIFDSFSPDQLGEVAGLLSEKKFKSEENIFLESEPGKNFFIVSQGRIKIYKMSVGGHVKVLDYLEVGDFFGEMALLDNTSRSANAVALTDSTLLILKKEDFTSLMGSQPELLLQIARTLSARLRKADIEIEMLSFSSVKKRLIQSIYNLADKYGEGTPEGILIPREFTHQDISELVGTAREVVSRVLRELKDEGLVIADGRNIFVKDLNRLLEEIRD